MQPDTFPDPDVLEAGLRTVFHRYHHALHEDGAGEGLRPALVGVCRRPNGFSSTFASEIVQCRFEDGSEAGVLCKYSSSNGQSAEQPAHRGVAYEARVYGSMLERLDVRVPRFYGAYEEQPAGRTWLILEYLADTTRLDLEPSEQAIRRTAAGIGRCHASCSSATLAAASAHMQRFDEHFYDSWRRRLSSVPDHFKDVFPWLSDLYAQSEALLAPLVSTAPVVVHAELFPSNVLIRDDDAYLVDWESAAIGAGEIDLALLTSGQWATDVIRDCELHYQAARWTNGPPPDHQATLAAARFYVAFKLLHGWLRFPPERATRDTWILSTLHSALDRLP
jgi:hypothetical protein